MSETGHEADEPVGGRLTDLGTGDDATAETARKIPEKLDAPVLPKRFYEVADYTLAEEGGFLVRLDGRAVRTPGKARPAPPNGRRRASSSARPLCR
jgi:chaperone required for assembly of F1-ATPase